METKHFKPHRRRDLATIVAQIHGVTPDHVRKILRGDRENDDILETVWKILDAENELLESVKKAVPFETTPKIKNS
jgi:hypothetical protein